MTFHIVSIPIGRHTIQLQIKSYHTVTIFYDISHSFHPYRTSYHISRKPHLVSREQPPKPLAPKTTLWAPELWSLVRASKSCTCGWLASADLFGVFQSNCPLASSSLRRHVVDNGNMFFLFHLLHDHSWKDACFFHLLPLLSEVRLLRGIDHSWKYVFFPNLLLAPCWFWRANLPLVEIWKGILKGICVFFSPAAFKGESTRMGILCLALKQMAVAQKTGTQMEPW